MSKRPCDRKHKWNYYEIVNNEIQFRVCMKCGYAQTRIWHNGNMQWSYNPIKFYTKEGAKQHIRGYEE